MRLKIDPLKGLEVIVPRRYPSSMISKFMHEKANWIMRHLQIAAYKHAQKPKFQDGMELTVAGIPKTIRILPTRKKNPYIKEARALKFKEDTAYYDGHEILIYCNGEAVSTGVLQQAKQALEKHLRAQAELLFKKRAQELAPQMDLTYNRITIKGQKSRWGSCSRSKNLNFNWRLILTSTEILDSIIVHELAHLKHLNHGPQFYAMVQKHCPNYRRLNKELKKWQSPI